ncbi:30S ribosomal protein S9 [Patescibacteria group bacterium]|nr:30S ribosomal protein S9 [Patescibacteria group bacterium]
MANKLKKKTVVQKVVKKAKPVAQAHADRPRVPANVTIPKGEYVTAVGRRKTATARVRVYKEAGDFIVNNKVVGEYFANVINAPAQYTQPFVLTDSQGKYAVIVKVDGSGINAQLDAAIHGISRALIKINPEYRLALKKAGLLSRDDRMKETRKIGTGGKARRAKQSPKR